MRDRRVRTVGFRRLNRRDLDPEVCEECGALVDQRSARRHAEWHAGVSDYGLCSSLGTRREVDVELRTEGLFPNVVIEPIEEAQAELARLDSVVDAARVDLEAILGLDDPETITPSLAELIELVRRRIEELDS